ncbi:TPA: hypothetical protein ACLE2D_002374 [Citrobacter freundii]|uniref:hypothetical protein n=1 Tax=Citrobacter freundii TaxID=546 RepID=UPI00396ADF23
MLNPQLLTALKIITSPTSTLVDMLIDSSSSFYSESKKDTDFEELAKRARRMELEMQLAESQAHVAQELAIAARIERAEEVEVEEVYEYAGEGKAGVQLDASSLNLGLSGGVKRVSRRICRFKGGLVSDSTIGLDQNSSDLGKLNSSQTEAGNS